jgi:hypothetical protein
VVGDAHGIHPQFPGAVYQVGDTADAVQHAVFGVGMEVGEHCEWHLVDELCQFMVDYPNGTMGSKAN